MKVLLLSLFDDWCLGLRSLHAVLHRAGHQTALIYVRSLAEMGDSEGLDDEHGFHTPPASVSGASFSALNDFIAHFQPQLIGISLTSNFFGLAAELTRRLRLATSCPIVWGGIDPTANPDLAIEHADVVCIGEGEGPIRELAAAIELGADYSTVANLWTRSGARVTRNAVRPLIQELDDLPFPDFFPHGKYHMSGGRVEPCALPPASLLHFNYPTLSGRGCPFSCTYCCNSMLRELHGARGYVRVRTVDNVIAEIRHARTINPEIRLVEFHDDVFGARVEWLRDFAHQYRRDVKLPFSCYTHFTACPAERVDLLRQAGVDFTIVGIQSGSQRVLGEIYNRQAPRALTIEVVRMLAAAGIQVILDLIAHNPLETEDDYRETLDLLLDLPRGFILHDINALSVYRNHPIASLLREQGVALDWQEGRNVYNNAEGPEHRFWSAILTLTQFETLEPDAIRAMSTDENLRQHPEKVEATVSRLLDQKYMPGTRLLRTP